MKVFLFHASKESPARALCKDIWTLSPSLYGRTFINDNSLTKVFYIVHVYVVVYQCFVLLVLSSNVNITTDQCNCVKQFLDDSNREVDQIGRQSVLH
mgnify:CR=1 FL=1